MSFDPNNVPLEYLLQPELLSERDIFNILEARCIRIDNMEHLNKEQLLNLFYRVVTPKQQRTNNRRLSGSNPAAVAHPHQQTLNKKVKKTNSNGYGSSDNNQTNGIVSHSCDKVQLKRSFNSETNSDDEPRAKKVRQKICWP